MSISDHADMPKRPDLGPMTNQSIQISLTREARGLVEDANAYLDRARTLLARVDNADDPDENIFGAQIDLKFAIHDLKALEADA